MEQQNDNQDSTIFNLNLDSTILNYLSETARWGKFLAIVGFIMCGILFLLGLILPAYFNKMSSYSPYRQQNVFGSMGVGFIFFIYIIIAIIYFFPCLYLLRFSNSTKAALASNDQFKLTDSFRNLKTLFKYVGVVTIVILSIYALMIVFGVISAMTR
jgi:hypothetical protein